MVVALNEDLNGRLVHLSHASWLSFDQSQKTSKYVKILKLLCVIVLSSSCSFNHSLLALK